MPRRKKTKEEELTYFEKTMIEIGYNPKVHFGYYNPAEDISESISQKVPLFWPDKYGNVCFASYDLDRNLRIKELPNISKNKSSSLAVTHRYGVIHRKRYCYPLETMRRLYSKSADKLQKKENDPDRYGPGLSTPYDHKEIIAKLKDKSYDPDDYRKFDKEIASDLGFYPYIPVQVLEAYQKGTKIPYLIITEGEKKAIVAANHKMWVIALPGIKGWRDKSKGEEIFEDITKIIDKCDPEKLIWLTDADTLVVNYKEGKDLKKRPSDFAWSVNKFRSVFRNKGRELYFAHIRTDSIEKGLDDLINANKDKIKAIEKSILTVDNKDSKKAPHFFDVLDLSLKDTIHIYNYFGITDVKQFYEKYRYEIDVNPFVYDNKIYVYNPEFKEFDTIRHTEFSQFLQIQNSFFQKAVMPTGEDDNGFMKYENVLTPLQRIGLRGSVKGNLISSKAIRNRLDDCMNQMPFYVGAVNEPSHTNYRDSISLPDKYGNLNKWFNLYTEVTHEPKKGPNWVKHNKPEDDIPVSMTFIKHMFGENKIEWKGIEYYEYEMGLEYIKVLWELPKQILPILVGASIKRKTGKTTFGQWLREIFQTNSIGITSKALNGQFTSEFATKLLVTIEEVVVDKKEIVERIKEIVTAKRTKLEAKFQDAKEILSYLKIYMTTNREDDFIPIDEDETRFWIRKIPEIPEDQKDKRILNRLIDEIPYFLKYLESLKFKFESNERGWFHHNLIETDALKKVKSKSRDGGLRMLETFLKNYMSTFQLSYCEFGLQKLVNMQEYKSMSTKWMTNILEKIECEFNENSNYYSLYKMEKVQYSEIGGPTQYYQIVEEKTKAPRYIFYARDFFPLYKIINFASPEFIEKHERLKRTKTKDSYLFNELDLDTIKSAINHYDLEEYDNNDAPSLGHMIAVYVENSSLGKKETINIIDMVIQQLNKDFDSGKIKMKSHLFKRFNQFIEEKYKKFRSNNASKIVNQRELFRQQ